MRRKAMIGMGVLLGGFLAAGVGIGIAAEGDGSSSGPPRADAQGRIVRESLPERVRVVDPVNGTERSFTRDEFIRLVEQPPPLPGQPGGPDPARVREYPSSSGERAR